MKQTIKTVLLKLWKSLSNKWLIFIVSGFLFVNAILLIISNVIIKEGAKNRLYASTVNIPYQKVGLVLGANRHTIYFKYRIKAAADLYHSGKIKYLLVSGDNHIEKYDEADDMRRALLADSVPDSAIVMDFAGFRTFDSMVRCKKVFLQDSVTVISQKFQLKRAIFIAKHFDLFAIGYIAKDAPENTSLYLREILARYKAFLDVYILNTKPKFLGKKYKIGQQKSKY